MSGGHWKLRGREALGAITLAGTRYGDVSRYAWPVALIALGAAFLLRGLLRRPPT